MGWAIFYEIAQQQAQILRCVGDGSPLTLPETIDGCPVTAIGPRCFAPGTAEGEGRFDARKTPPPPALPGAGNLRRIALPGTLTALGERAFAGCRDLKRLELPPGLTVMGVRCFEGCGLEHMDLPTELKALPDYAFAQCRALVRLTLPEGLESLGRCGFYNCKALQGLTLPDSVTFTGESLFMNCGALARLSVPMGVNLSVLLSDLPNALELTVRCGDGDARFFLPRFSYEYESVTAPRVWRTITYGAGQLYRECFSSRDIDFDLYEGYFETALLQDEVADTVRIALCRLRWPYRLGRGRGRYLDHLARHWDTALDLLMDGDDLEGLEDLLGLVPPAPDTLDRLTARARERNKVFFVSRLMDARAGAGDEKCFDL